MSDKLLIRRSTVLSMDHAIGDLPRADILVGGDTIAAVQPGISEYLVGEAAHRNTS
jgi:hypothetical protein